MEDDSQNPLFLEALQCHQQGQFDRAEALYHQALESDSNLINALQNLIDLALRKGDQGRALEFAVKAREIQPESSHAQYNFAIVSQQMGRLQEAAQALEKAIELAPGWLEAHFNLGNVLYTLGKKAEAEKAYQKSLEIDPNYIPALLNLGNLVAESGKYDLGLEFLRRAESVQPNFGPTLKALGMMLHALNRLDEAVRYYQLAYSGMPDDLELIVLLGNGFRDQGRHPEAIEYYRRALAADPQNSVAKQNLGMLEGSRIHSWHVEMLADTARNEAYDLALHKAVKPNHLVLDIGAGSGLLSMMAARAGAGQVVACEMVETLAQTAQEIVDLNGYAEKIKVLNLKSSSLRVGEELPRKADLVVSEILDVGLLGEGVLPSLRHAAANLAAENSVMIPLKAEIRAVLIESQQQRQISPLSQLCGFDLSPFNKYRSQGTYRLVHLSTVPHQKLTEEFSVFTLDFRNLPPHVPPSNPNLHPLKIPVKRDGFVQGVAFWFKLWLDEEICLSSGPGGEMIHWGQALFMLDSDRKVVAGEELELVAKQSELLIAFDYL
ncbi:MAG: tetratricopeptide repeat protein [Bacteroidia bacterium]|nr:tetratricopeptide repeat protein [Bacteroidia bacterium]